MARKLILEFPEEFSDKDLHDKEVIMKAREGVVMELLRQGKISQGKAAEFLNIDRSELFDLMAKYEVAIANFSLNELNINVKIRTKQENRKIIKIKIDIEEIKKIFQELEKMKPEIECMQVLFEYMEKRKLTLKKINSTALIDCLTKLSNAFNAITEAMVKGETIIISKGNQPEFISIDFKEHKMVLCSKM